MESGRKRWKVGGRWKMGERRWKMGGRRWKIDGSRWKVGATEVSLDGVKQAFSSRGLRWGCTTVREGHEIMESTSEYAGV